MNYLLSLLLVGLIAQQTVYKKGYIYTTTDTISVSYYMDSVKALELDKQIKAKESLNNLMKPK